MNASLFYFALAVRFVSWTRGIEIKFRNTTEIKIFNPPISDTFPAFKHKRNPYDKHLQRIDFRVYETSLTHHYCSYLTCVVFN
jgi:hypothetical protein